MIIEKNLTKKDNVGETMIDHHKLTNLYSMKIRSLITLKKSSLLWRLAYFLGVSLSALDHLVLTRLSYNKISLISHADLGFESTSMIRKTQATIQVYTVYNENLVGHLIQIELQLWNHILKESIKI